MSKQHLYKSTLNSHKKLLVVGELNIDLILNQIEGFPKIGTEITAGNMNFTLGSSSAIMASNCAALGVDTSFCGMLGEDDFGRFILQELKNKSVDTKLIKQTSQEKTGITVVMNYEQDRANVTYCGAMDILTVESIPWEQLEGFSHLHLSNFFLQKGIRKQVVEIFRRAKGIGLTTSLDMQWDPENKWDFDYKTCLPYVDIFLPNEAELKALTGITDVEKAISHLKPYLNILALKRGNEGGKVVSGDAEIEVPPFLNKTFADAIGAGDSFNAGFIEKYLEGGSLQECLENANLVGSLSTTAPGGTGAFSSLSEIQQKKEQIRQGQF